MKEYENELYKNGIELIGGVDEVGRGPLVGPVVCACVILPKDYYNEEIFFSQAKMGKSTLSP